MLSSPGGGQLVAAREIAGADGTLLARAASCASGAGGCDCRDSGWRCEASTFDVWGREIVLGTRALYSLSRVDPRDVIFDRRVLEVVADGVTTHEVALASIRQAPHDCPTAR